ncbi:1-phosphofructokinase family hexose kinase [Octadecabacter sp. CECT 8868]|uniref:1-phosphofructokinase family hexose kinase n=1 Tax=Octadecabacter algicola TaxID=2909342 RepID=UPI00300DBDB7|nr:1-phosphofructokinase family hexose kinase [Octadecabacter algicola]
MRDILTVTLNPALDLATSAFQVRPNEKLRCAQPHPDPGGGGLNVARAVHQLGGTARPFVALGGNTGSVVKQLLENAGLDIIVHDAPGDTRQSLAVTDLSTSEQFRFMLAGPDWNAAQLQAMRISLAAIAKPNGFIVLSGSGPNGASPNLYAEICQDLSQIDAEILIDTSGPPLAHLAAGQDRPPFLLRMDQHEAETLARRPLVTRKDSADFAKHLVDQGAARTVIVARGRDGSVLADGQQQLRVNAANIEVRSRVGAGDSFIGGFTMALARDLPLGEAFRHGAAAASAACMTEGTQLCLLPDFQAVLPLTQIETL